MMMMIMMMICTSKLGDRWRTKTRITEKSYDLQGQRSKVARSRDAYDSCWPISRKLSLRNTKIGRKVVHTTGNNAIIDSP